MRIVGTLASGRGEGRRFLAMRQYKQGFEKTLGFIPFEGTLNLGISEHDAKLLLSLRESSKHVVGGFDEGGKRFHNIKCIPSSVLGMGGALIFPRLTHHPPTTIEFVSRAEMRKSHGLRDGDKIQVEVD